MGFKVLGLMLGIEGILVAVFTASAGRWDWPWFWAVIGLHATGMVFMFTTIDPDLLKERIRPGPGGKDPYVRVLLTPFILAHLVVAGLDIGRFHWTGPIPWPLHALGLLGYALGMVLSVGAMRANRFFSPVVRLQTERGHHVISTGPYSLMRHPGYAGMLVAILSEAFAIGSLWSLVPLLPVVAFIVWRTGMEERFLRAELAGYEAYTQRVRYRLLPGVW